ncbi:MAG TPA: hypothetical protein EYP08_00700, partial [Pyrodictiaceae archaeon]|nr:hypothetical protein [Pyrodictiaceae archaeon]
MSTSFGSCMRCGNWGWVEVVKLAVILASGEGSRLSKVAGRYGKPLVDLFGFPLIAYPLSSLAAAGISEFIIVANMYNEELL